MCGFKNTSLKKSLWLYKVSSLVFEEKKYKKPTFLDAAVCSYDLTSCIFYF